MTSRSEPLGMSPGGTFIKNMDYCGVSIHASLLLTFLKSPKVKFSKRFNVYLWKDDFDALKTEWEISQLLLK